MNNRPDFTSDDKNAVNKRSQRVAAADDMDVSKEFEKNWIQYLDRSWRIFYFGTCTHLEHRHIP